MTQSHFQRRYSKPQLCRHGHYQGTQVKQAGRQAVFIGPLNFIFDLGYIWVSSTPCSIDPVCVLFSTSSQLHLSSAGGENVAVTGVEDGHGGAAEELTASGAKLDCGANKLASVFPPKSDWGLFLRETGARRCAMSGP